MKSLCMFLLENWYSDVRKSVPATVSKRINAGIRSFENSSDEVKEAVQLAKNSGAAAEARRRRKQVLRTLYHGKLQRGNIVHKPSKKGR